MAEYTLRGGLRPAHTAARQRVSDSYALGDSLPSGFLSGACPLASARSSVSGLAEGLGSAKQRHIRHNILMSI